MCITALTCRYELYALPNLYNYTTFVRYTSYVHYPNDFVDTSYMPYPTSICITVLTCQYDLYVLPYWRVNTSCMRYPTDAHYRVDLSIWGTCIGQVICIIVLKCQHELYALRNVYALLYGLVNTNYMRYPSYRRYRIDLSILVTRNLYSHTILYITMTICDKLYHDRNTLYALLVLTSQKLCCEHLSTSVTCHWQLT